MIVIYGVLCVFGVVWMMEKRGEISGSFLLKTGVVECETDTKRKRGRMYGFHISGLQRLVCLMVAYHGGRYVNFNAADAGRI